MATNARTISASESLRFLSEGNERFVNGLRSIERAPNVNKVRELAEKGQRPIAAILTCSDSRIPTEMLFDRGLGDLFVVRTAGNIVAPSLIASIEFSMLSFDTPLCLVMGHTACGAVSTAMKHAEGKIQGHPSPHLEELVNEVMPAIQTAKRACKHDHEPAELLFQATLENVRRSVHQLEKQSRVIREKVSSSEFLIVGAVCDLFTGRVLFDTARDDVRAILEDRLPYEIVS